MPEIHNKELCLESLWLSSSDPRFNRLHEIKKFSLYLMYVKVQEALLVGVIVPRYVSNKHFKSDFNIVVLRQLRKWFFMN